MTVLIFLGCTVVGKSMMRRGQFRRMLIQNGTFACMLLTAIALMIKIKKASKHPKKSNSQAAI